MRSALLSSKHLCHFKKGLARAERKNNFFSNFYQYYTHRKKIFHDLGYKTQPENLPTSTRKIFNQLKLSPTEDLRPNQLVYRFFKKDFFKTINTWNKLKCEFFFENIMQRNGKLFELIKTPF